jgi:hypothetical protein
MSGWAAARLVAEATGARRVYLADAPGLGPYGQRLMESAPFAFAGSTAFVAPPRGYAVGATSVTGGGGAGLLHEMRLGQGALRLNLSLRQRLAALECRTEERDKRFMALRRYYTQLLKNYHLESKVMSGFSIYYLFTTIVTSAGALCGAGAPAG